MGIGEAELDVDLDEAAVVPFGPADANVGAPVAVDRVPGAGELQGIGLALGARRGGNEQRRAHERGGGDTSPTARH